MWFPVLPRSYADTSIFSISWREIPIVKSRSWILCTFSWKNNLKIYIFGVEKIVNGSYEVFNRIDARRFVLLIWWSYCLWLCSSLSVIKYLICVYKWGLCSSSWSLLAHFSLWTKIGAKLLTFLGLFGNFGVINEIISSVLRT